MKGYLKVAALVAGSALMVGCSSNSVKNLVDSYINSSDAANIKSQLLAALTAKIKGTAPKAKVEAFCADGNYTMVHTVKNGANKNAFTLRVPKNVPCRLVMTTNENNASTILVTKVDVNGSKQVKVSDTLNLGNVNLPVKQAPGANSYDANNDHLTDSAYRVDVNASSAILAQNASNKFDADHDGEVDLLQDKNTDGSIDMLDDYNGNGKPDALEDRNGNGKPDIEDDTNKDGIPDMMQDKNHDGKPDIVADTNSDGIPDALQDSNNNGVPDTMDGGSTNPNDNGNGNDIGNNDNGNNTSNEGTR